MLFHAISGFKHYVIYKQDFQIYLVNFMESIINFSQMYDLDGSKLCMYFFYHVKLCVFPHNMWYTHWEHVHLYMYELDYFISESAECLPLKVCPPET